MKLWKIEKLEQHERSCVCCEGIGLHTYHTEYMVLSLEERLLLGVSKDVESLKTGDNIILRITLVDEDVKVEDGT